MKNWIVLGLQGIGMTLTAAAPFLDGSILTYDPTAHNLSSSIGLVLFGSATALGIVAAFTMGRSFTVQSTPKSGGDLVVRFPFSMIRNPIYTAILIVGVAVTLIFKSPGALLATVYLTAVLWWKVSMEEVGLRAQFGRSYDDYCRQVGRFLPKIFRGRKLKG